MQVCDHLSTISKTKGGGKNKKKQQGRPSKENIYDVTRHIHTITPPAITSPTLTTSSELATTLATNLCILCQPISCVHWYAYHNREQWAFGYCNLLSTVSKTNDPHDSRLTENSAQIVIELLQPIGGVIVCICLHHVFSLLGSPPFVLLMVAPSDCCCKWLQFSQKLDCPCCYSHQLSTETIKTPNSVILGLFEKRQVPQQSQITVQAILDTPRTTPTNHVEKQVATSLVKRLLSESEGGVISIPTKGKVTYTVKWKSHMQNSICSQSL